MQAFADRLAAADPAHRYLAITSLLIFGLTFLVFANCDYRLVFLAPLLLAAARLGGSYALAVAGAIAAILWLPHLPSGWSLANLACYGLFALLAPAAANLAGRTLHNLHSSVSRGRHPG